MTDTYMKITPLLLSSILFVIVIFIVEPAYIIRINTVPFENKQLIYMLGSLIVLVAFAATMVNVLGETVKSEYQIKYWLVLSRQEFFIWGCRFNEWKFVKRQLHFYCFSEEIQEIFLIYLTVS